MRLLPTVLVALLLLPAALAQNASTPPPANGSELPGPEESIEGAPGIVYGLAILVGTVAVAGLLAYVSRRQRKGGP